MGYHACIEGQPLKVAVEGVFTLWRLPWAEPRASMVFGEPTVLTPDVSLRTVVEPTFDPARTIVLESPPGRSARGDATGSGTAAYRQVDPEHAVVRTNATASGWLVVRNPYDRNWHATVDGRAVPIRVADYLLQGIPVPAGTHVVELSYRDPAIAWGISASVAGWIVLLGVIAWLWRRERVARRERRAQGRPDERDLLMAAT